jgi:hypothetical protein
MLFRLFCSFENFFFPWKIFSNGLQWIFYQRWWNIGGSFPELSGMEIPPLNSFTNMGNIRIINPTKRINISRMRAIISKSWQQKFPNRNSFKKLMETDMSEKKETIKYPFIHNSHFFLFIGHDCILFKKLYEPNRKENLSHEFFSSPIRFSTHKLNLL